MAKAALGPYYRRHWAKGPRWRVQSLARCPRSDYLRGLNSIVHANFITTTLAPMGEHRLREPERWAALRWKGRNETKGVWMGPSRAEIAKGGYFAPRRMFESSERRDRKMESSSEAFNWGWENSVAWAAARIFCMGNGDCARSPYVLSSRLEIVTV